MKARVLVFGWGNPSRGDDGLGAAFVGEAMRVPGVDLLVDYQLQPEHALDLVGRDEVLFVDASTSGQEPFEVFELAPGPNVAVSTHHLSPGGLLAVYQRVMGKPPPRARLLAIRGWQFGLGEQLSEKARANLDAALEWWRAQSAALALSP